MWIHSKKLWRAGATIAVLLCMVEFGCRRKAPAAPPAPAVSASVPLQREVIDWDEYPGRVAAVDTVEVRARVSGFLKQSQFKEGAMVRQGEVLFVLDTDPYQAELQRAQAALAQAEAQQRFASSEYTRMQPLQKIGAVAETQFLQARQAFETANAAVQSAQAALETAKLNVQWCQVVAPISGRVGRRLVTPGNLITGGVATGTLLTTIVSLDPIYCYIDIDERSMLRYQKLAREHERAGVRSGRLAAELAVGTQREFEYRGHVDFQNNAVDPNTGTISIRGVFANPNQQLVPGLYARMRIPARGPHMALLVPDRAIGTTLAQQYVLVVGPNDVVQFRAVTLGPEIAGLREVSGINPTDRVIVEGLLNARPGVKVRVRQVVITAAQTQPTTRSTGPTSAPAGGGGAYP